MTDSLQQIIRKATGAIEIINIGVIQSLWSGYGNSVPTAS